MSLKKTIFSKSFRTAAREYTVYLSRKTNQLTKRYQNTAKLPVPNDRTSRNKNLRRAVNSVSLFGVTRCFLGFFEKKDTDPVMINIKLGKLAAARQEDEAAEKYYHIAIAAVDDQFRNKKIERKDYLDAKSNIFDDLANLALRRGEYKKAEKLYKETMKACLQNGMDKSHNAMVEMTIKLGSIYAITKREEEARIGYQEAIKIQEAKVKENPESDKDTLVLLGLALESYGRFCMFHRQYKEAEPLFIRAETIATRVLGKEHPQRIVILNDIATVQILREKLSEAESTLHQAVEVGTVNNVPELPALHSNLGAIYLRSSRLNEAEKSCSIALAKAKENNNKHAQKQAEFCLQKVHEERKKVGMTS